MSRAKPPPEGPPPAHPIYVTRREYNVLVGEFLPDLPKDQVNAPQPRTLYGRPLIIMEDFCE